MKWLDFYSNTLGCNKEEEVFSHLKKTLQPTNRSWDYFVDWDEVRKNIDSISGELNALDELIGCEDVENAIIKLTKRKPSVKRALSILIALRKNKFKVLEDIKTTPFTDKNYKDIDISSKASSQDVLDFMVNSGIINLLRNGEIKSFREYVLGVEVGIGTNARKNRGGKAMEKIVEASISPLREKYGWCYIAQATKSKIKNKFNEIISIEQANRRIDFAVKTEKSLFLIEANFYNDGGSKLSSIANGYRNDHRKYGHPFVWITDGQGWLGDNSLKDAFKDLNYILNIDMMQKGLLEEILKQEKP